MALEESELPDMYGQMFVKPGKSSTETGLLSLSWKKPCGRDTSSADVYPLFFYMQSPKTQLV